jgi:hypothetical protein
VLRCKPESSLQVAGWGGNEAKGDRPVRMFYIGPCTGRAKDVPSTLFCYLPLLPLLTLQDPNNDNADAPTIPIIQTRHLHYNQLQVPPPSPYENTFATARRVRPQRAIWSKPRRLATWSRSPPPRTPRRMRMWRCRTRLERSMASTSSQ